MTTCGSSPAASCAPNGVRAQGRAAAAIGKAPLEQVQHAAAHRLDAHRGRGASSSRPRRAARRAHAGGGPRPGRSARGRRPPGPGRSPRGAARPARSPGRAPHRARAARRVRPARRPGRRGGDGASGGTSPSRRHRRGAQGQRRPRLVLRPISHRATPSATSAPSSPGRLLEPVACRLDGRRPVPGQHGDRRQRQELARTGPHHRRDPAGLARRTLPASRTTDGSEGATRVTGTPDAARRARGPQGLRFVAHPTPW